MNSLSVTGRTFEMPEHFSVHDYMSHIHEYQDQNTKAKAKEPTLVTVRLQGRSEVLDALCNQWFLHLILSQEALTMRPIPYASGLDVAIYALSATFLWQRSQST